MRILIIDKDKAFNQNLAFFLKSKGMVSDCAYSAEEGMELVRLYDYDALIFEFHLIDMSGIEFLKRLRANGNKMPVLVCSINGIVSTKIDCLTYGADDYMVKPCDKNEMVARLKAIIRRSRGYAHSVVQVGRMSVNLDSKQVKIDEIVVPLTGKEYSLIELLALKKGMTVSKEQFLNHLYGGMDEPEMKIVDVFLFHIRDKIKKIAGNTTYIQTIWGRGYVLREDN